MSTERTGSRKFALLKSDLSGRDLAIVAQVADLRLMSTRQIEAVQFHPAEHRSALAAARAARRVLERLAGQRLLVRLERPIGGVRAGSGAFVYGLGPVGHRLLKLEQPRPRSYREPTRLFVKHTLAVGNIVVGLTLAARSGRCELLLLQAEPRCWREFSGAFGRTLLKPDLFVALGKGDFEDRFFVEVDRATEHLPSLVRKCRLYDAYYRTGTEQARHGVFPKVCLVVPDPERAGRLEQAIRAEHRLDQALFLVTTSGQALDCLTGANT